MKIGIDGNEANQKNRVGVGQFAYSVLREIERFDKKNSFVVYLKNSPLPDMPQARNGWQYKIFGPGKLWTQIALPFKLFTQIIKLDVFFTPSHYAPRFSPCPTVISIMDLWHHRHPEQFAKKDLYQLTKWESYSVKKAAKIIAISEFTKKEILKFYRYPEEKIVVAYPGYTKYKLPACRQAGQVTSNKLQTLKNKHKIVGDYLLYLGTLQPKKNIEGLIKAFGLLNTDIKLVIAGKKGWLFEKIFSLVKELKLEGSVVFTGFVEEEEKPYLITGAKAFILPSFYEGFGIPAAEAMSLGVPVILSKEGSLPEVGGNAAVYFDPYQVKDIVKEMEKVLSLNKEGLDEIIKEGKRQAEKFSWKACARRILETLEDVKR